MTKIILEQKVVLIKEDTKTWGPLMSTNLTPLGTRNPSQQNEKPC